jgi:hypothetical protein
MADLPAAGFVIQAFDITLLGHRQWGIDVYLQEAVRADGRSGSVTIGLKWRNQCHDYRQAGVHHQYCHGGRAAIVLSAISIAEAKIVAQVLAQCVAIEHTTSLSGGQQLLLDVPGNGGFAGARQAGQPNRKGDGSKGDGGIYG